jgi:membrane fusion protein, multidrug efflux system
MSNASFSEKSGPASLDKPLAPEAPAEPKPRPARRRRRWVLMLGVIGAVVLIVVGIPRVIHTLNTVSTDDAYVNSHVTFVAPRVIGQVARVLVDDNYRVKTGDVLVELDPEPYQVQVAIQQANVNSARANLVETQATVRGLVGQLRSRRFKLTRAIEDVDNQIALVRARVATAP